MQIIYNTHVIDELEKLLETHRRIDEIDHIYYDLQDIKYKWINSQLSYSILPQNNSVNISVKEVGYLNQCNPNEFHYVSCQGKSRSTLTLKLSAEAMEYIRGYTETKI